MKPKHYYLTIIILFIVLSCSKQNKIEIKYPFDKTIFPPEISAPTIMWADSLSGAEKWKLSITHNKKELISITTDSLSWRPQKEKWEKVKKESQDDYSIIKIEALNTENKPIASRSVRIKTSKDEVGAQIFYRDLPLPFSFALANLEEVKWRLGDISSYESSPVMLENIPVCGNCHCFTPDGKYFAMDMDAADDKGSYVITEVEENTIMDYDHIITWTDFQPGETTYGLLSQISPDGRYVASTLKDDEIFEALDDFEFSNFFFPLKGIIVIYDKLTKKFFPLAGADDSTLVQSNPVWSPDGKELLFCRAKAVPRSESGLEYATIIKNEGLYYKMLDDFKKRKKLIKYDIYKVPFNEGKGGKAVPLQGASHNKMSNFFPKYSPDGKWIIYAQAQSFMLHMMDSKLYIIPAKGGEPRALKCNTPKMNSWHSWSPNSKWLVFSSKMRGPFTRLYLTHIDENGNDSPPVFLENFADGKRAINIPEFLNTNNHQMKRIVPKFLEENPFIFRRGEIKFKEEDYEAALANFKKAIALKADDYEAYAALGDVKIRTRNYQEAVEAYEKAIEIKPDFARAIFNLAQVEIELNQLDKAYKNIEKAIALNSKMADYWAAKANIHARKEEWLEAIENYDKAIKETPKSQTVYNRGHIKNILGDVENAEKDFKWAVKLDPKNPYPQSALGDIAGEKGNIQEAVNYYKKAIEINPANKMLVITLKKLESNLRAKKEELQRLNIQIGNGLQSYEPYYYRSLIKVSLNDYAGALIDMEEALRIKKDLIVGYKIRGVIKKLLGDYNGALNDFNYSVQKNPNDPLLYLERAKTYEAMGNLNKAAKDFIRAAGNDDRNRDIFYKIGMIYLKLKDKNEACKHFRKAAKAGHLFAQTALEKHCK